MPEGTIPDGGHRMRRPRFAPHWNLFRSRLASHRAPYRDVLRPYLTLRSVRAHTPAPPAASRPVARGEMPTHQDVSGATRRRRSFQPPDSSPLPPHSRSSAARGDLFRLSGANRPYSLGTMVIVSEGDGFSTTTSSYHLTPRSTKGAESTRQRGGSQSIIECLLEETPREPPCMPFGSRRPRRPISAMISSWRERPVIRI